MRESWSKVIRNYRKPGIVSVISVAPVVKQLHYFRVPQLLYNLHPHVSLPLKIPWIAMVYLHFPASNGIFLGYAMVFSSNLSISFDSPEKQLLYSGTVYSTIQNHGFTILSPGPRSPRLTCTLRRHWPTTSPGSAGRPEIGWKIPWMWLESLICWEYAVAATNNKQNIELLQWYASINEVRRWCTVCSCGKLTDLWGFNVQFRVCAMQCNLKWKPPK